MSFEAHGLYFVVRHVAVPVSEPAPSLAQEPSYGPTAQTCDGPRAKLWAYGPILWWPGLSPGLWGVVFVTRAHGHGTCDLQQN